MAGRSRPDAASSPKLPTRNNKLFEKKISDSSLRRWAKVRSPTRTTCSNIPALLVCYDTRFFCNAATCTILHLHALPQVRFRVQILLCAAVRKIQINPLKPDLCKLLINLTRYLHGTRLSLDFNRYIITYQHRRL